MALTIHCKCTCASCGTEINYTSDQAGNVVQCPKCGEKSRLPEPERLGLLEHKGPPLPQSRRCEICGSQINFLETACPFCAAQRNKRALRNWIILGASAVAVVVIIGAVIHQLNKPKPVVVVPSTPHIMIAAPVARMPKSTNDLHPQGFVLERMRGDTLATAVGDIVNMSENVHHQIKADVDLLDRNGKKIGTVSDYFVDLGAHQTWHFVANVTDTNAVNARFGGIKEDQ